MTGKKPDWSTTPNVRRKRPMGTITMSPAGWLMLDVQRAPHGRGEYIEELLRLAKRAAASRAVANLSYRKHAMRKSSNKPTVSPAYVSNLPEVQLRKASKT